MFNNMKRKVPTQRYIDLVKEYNPNAECKLRPNGKEYYQIIDKTAPISILGQGKTRDEAWRAAYRNVND